MSAPGFPPDRARSEMGGVAAAIVTDNEDPEGLGRVRVTYPWREAADMSYWARIAVPMAGDDTGTYFLPEREDEVLVGFENGDVEHPYVLGALWNGEAAPPEDNADGSNDVRTIRSRSGHEIVLNDAEDGPTVEIRTGGGNAVVLDDTGGSETVRVEDSGGNAVTLDATQGSVQVSGASTVRITAPMLELAADGNAKIEAGGVLELKGALININ